MYVVTIVHHDDQRHTCRMVVDVSQKCLVLEPYGDQSHQQLWLEQLALRVGGANNSLVFFTPQNHPLIKQIFVVKQAQLINQLREIPGSEEQPWAQQLYHWRQRQLVSWLAVVGIVVAAVVGFMVLRGPAVTLLASWVPYSWERSFGDALASQMVAEPPPYAGQEKIAELSAEVRRLERGLPQQLLPVQIHYSTDPQVNAFALPGGHIIFNKGFLKAADSLEEILGVAAHELAHVKERHVLRSLIDAAGIYLLIDLVIGDFAGLATLLSDGGALLLNRSFSREQEARADEVGFNMLVQEGINPEGMITFFRKLQKERQPGGDQGGVWRQVGQLLSTHPLTDERITALNQLNREIAGHISFEPLEFDIEKLHAVLPR